MTALFKIFEPEDWARLCRDGRTDGSALDRRDGFLHFSTAAQLPGTLALHFRGAGSIVVARIPEAALRDRGLRWETARDGSLFPHLYGALSVRDIDRHWRLSCRPDGFYDLPELRETP